MSCFQRTLRSWCRKTSSCLKWNGDLSVSNSLRAGFTTWYTSQSHTSCCSEDPSQTPWLLREPNRCVCESVENSFHCTQPFVCDCCQFDSDNYLLSKHHTCTQSGSLFGQFLCFFFCGVLYVLVRLTQSN